MTTKEDPIISLSKSTFGKKNDLMQFKEETLRDFKQIQKRITERYENIDIEMRERLEAYEKRITTYENKIMELSNLINTDKTIREKVDNLMEFKEKTDDHLLTEKIRLDNFRNDLKSNVERIDKILTDSVIYPGIIGGISKYKTFHDLIDYLLTQTSQTLTFREKSILDFKSYKTKLENIISSFNNQINNLLNTTSEFTKTCVQEAEERMKSIYNIFDDRLQDARIENANYAIGLEKATEVLKKELENLYVVKNELYEKVDKGMAEVKNDNTRVVKLFSGYKKNFHIMQHKFTQLSDFIKDIRFRINLKEDVQRREYAHMSNMINFDKKHQPGFYDGVYSTNLMKKGFGAQLKDYIEGKITADQLFKKRRDQNSSNVKSNTNDNKGKNNLTNLNNTKEEEETKFNFIDLFKESMKSKVFGESKSKTNKTKDVIKEEDENNIDNELNFLLNKTEKEKNISNNNNQNSVSNFKVEEIKEEVKQENSGRTMEKEIIIKPKTEEEKIQIISKDKDKDKDKDKENENDSNKKVLKKYEKQSSIKNAITNLFNVKNIMENIKKDPSESQIEDKTKNENKNKNKIRPMTVNTIRKKNIDTNPLKSNNSNVGTTINEEIEIVKHKKKPSSSLENKKEVQEKKGKENVYNKTMNSLGQNMPLITTNIINKKANSSNKKNVKYFVKQNKDNNSNKGNRAFSGIRTDEAKTFENMFNNLKSYIPKNDFNMEQNSLFQKKKK